MRMDDEPLDKTEADGMEGLERDEIGRYNRLLCGSDFSLRLRDKDSRVYLDLVTLAVLV